MKMALPVDKAGLDIHVEPHTQCWSVCFQHVHHQEYFFRNFILLDFETDSCSQLTRPQVILPPLHIKYDFLLYREAEKRKQLKSILINNSELFCWWFFFWMYFMFSFCSLSYCKLSRIFNFSKPLFHSLKIEVLEAHTVFFKLKVSWHLQFHEHWSIWMTDLVKEMTWAFHGTENYKYIWTLHLLDHMDFIDKYP